jgi:hypothetical protein
MGCFVIGRRLGPADDVEGSDAALGAHLVVGFGAVLQRLQQVVGIPGLGVLIGDMAAVGVGDRHEPERILLRDDEAEEVLIGRIAERPHEGRAFGDRNEAVGIGKPDRGEIAQGHIGGAIGRRLHRRDIGPLDFGLRRRLGAVLRLGGGQPEEGEEQEGDHAGKAQGHGGHMLPVARRNDVKR